MEPFNPFTKRNPVADFEIGTNKSCSLEVKSYCNGPLRGGRTYHVKIRAFTDDDKFSDTGFKGMATDQDNAWLILALAIPLSLLLIFLVCFAYFRWNVTNNDSFCNKRPKPIPHEPTSLSESIVDTTWVLNFFSSRNAFCILGKWRFLYKPLTEESIERFTGR